MTFYLNTNKGGKFVEKHKEGHSLGAFCCSSDNGFVSTDFFHQGENFEATPEHEETIHGIFRGFLLDYQHSLESIKLPRLVLVGEEIVVV